MIVIGKIKRRLMDFWKRGVVLMVNSDDQLQSLQLQHSSTEIADNVEHFEPYGYTSNPHAGAEVLIVSRGGLMNHIIALVTPDRRHRLTGLQPGEVAIYDDLGNKVVLKRDKIEVTAVSHIDITAPTCTITATTTIDGDLTVSGQISSPTGISTSDIELGSHGHSGVRGGPDNSGGPV